MSIIKLSKRLKAIAAQANNCNLLIDVGTDHGYVPIALVKTGVAKRAISSDVSKESLDKAIMNINSCNLSDKICARLGNGLTVIRKEKVDLIIMAGMGGMLMIDILKASPDIVSGAGQMILQPQLDIKNVRQFVHSIGYKIVNEQMIYEDSKYYTILKCEKGDETYNEIDYLLGKILIDRRCIILKKFLEHERLRIEKLIYTIEGNKKVMALRADRSVSVACDSVLTPPETENRNRRLTELKKIDAIYKEVLELYEIE